ncbi:MAG: triphosphoribosyl-dephospho-CoA synthase CitG [Faecalibacterium sp.]
MPQTVELYQMLEARERRFLRQQGLLRQYKKPLVCFTMNIAGPVKDSPLIRRSFAHGCALLRRQLLRLHTTPLHEETIQEATGCEAYFVLEMDPLAVKRITAGLEEESPLGRLFDMDVLRPDGCKVEREEVGSPGRTCLICGGPAKICSSRRLHPVTELQQKTAQIMEEAIRTLDAETAAQQAVRALLYEVGTTPKPGLVDRQNNGSHRDMDCFTFMSSATALWPYFRSCTRTGQQTADRPAAETFAALRPLGCKAEGDMLAATHGVNTHKGAIFTVGILCAALGRLNRALWSCPERVLQEISSMTAGLTGADFAGLTKENASTVGQRLYLKYGITGIRGQVEAGLPAVREYGLPVLEQGLAQGYDLNRSGCAALLAILANSTDTNMIARSDRATQQAVAQELRELLKRNPYPDEETLNELDRRFIAANLSPGGSADLLAVCYLLHFLKNEVTEDV